MSAKQESGHRRADNQHDLSYIAQYNAGHEHDYRPVDSFGQAIGDPDGINYSYEQSSEWQDGSALPDHAFFQDDYGYHDLAVNSPPMSRSNTASEGSRQTRSGRPIPRTDSPLSSAQSISGTSHGVTKSPSPRKGRAKKAKEPTIMLAEPLSMLTKDLGVPLRDMEKWANRSTEDRRKEAEQRGWKIARPMNRFMMYRSAYAEATKRWCSRNNHQVVSEVTGQSWKKLEPQEIKDYYDRLATIERENHQKAFPDYKFSPAKANNKAVRKKRELGYYDDDLSDDPDGEWAPGGRQPKQSRKPPPQHMPAPAVPSHYPFANTNRWEFPTRTTAASYNQMQPYPGQHQLYANQMQPYPIAGGQYLQAAVHVPSQQHLHDARMAMNSTPTSVRSSGPLVSLPGGQHNELLQSRNATPVSTYQQPQTGGNYMDQTGLLHPDQTHYVLEPDLNVGVDSNFQEAMNGYDMASAHGASQATVNAEPNPYAVDPQLEDLFEDSPYQQYYQN